MRRQIPNALTLSRLIGAGVFIAMLGAWDANDPARDDRLLLASLAVFVLAVVTDALDGYLARRWNVVSLFGRVMDPLADKVIVLGAFVMLASPAFRVDLNGAPTTLTGVTSWMAVVILSRELLVTAIRSVMEAQGVDFSASWSGKLKMILQSFAIPVMLLFVWLALRSEPDQNWVRFNSIIAWSVVAVTVISGLPYVTRAVTASKHLREDRSDPSHP